MPDSAKFVYYRNHSLFQGTFKFMAETQSKLSRRMAALIWLVVVAIVIGVLIYFKQIALLYVLATVGLTALLLIVGFSDLENVDRDASAGFAADR